MGTQRNVLVAGVGGLGTEVCRLLTADGWLVRGTDLNVSSIESALAEGILASGLVTDLTTEEGVREAMDALKDDALDALVVTLGISPKDNGIRRPFAKIEREEWDAVFSVNVTAPFLLVREALPALMRADAPSVVTISSAAAIVGAGSPEHNPSGAHYAASKAALENLVVSLSTEYSHLGLRVNGLAPGLIEGAMGGSISAETQASVVEQLPIGRPAKPSEVAQCVAFLCSDSASYVTGTILRVDGGWTRR